MSIAADPVDAFSREDNLTRACHFGDPLAGHAGVPCRVSDAKGAIAGAAGEREEHVDKGGEVLK